MRAPAGNANVESAVLKRATHALAAREGRLTPTFERILPHYFEARHSVQIVGRQWQVGPTQANSRQWGLWAGLRANRFNLHSGQRACLCMRPSGVELNRTAKPAGIRRRRVPRGCAGCVVVCCAIAAAAQASCVVRPRDRGQARSVYPEAHPWSPWRSSLGAPRVSCVAGC